MSGNDPESLVRGTAKKGGVRDHQGKKVLVGQVGYFDSADYEQYHKSGSVSGPKPESLESTNGTKPNKKPKVSGTSAQNKDEADVGPPPLK